MRVKQSFKPNNITNYKTDFYTALWFRALHIYTTCEINIKKNLNFNRDIKVIRVFFIKIMR